MHTVGYQSVAHLLRFSLFYNCLLSGKTDDVRLYLICDFISHATGV